MLFFKTILLGLTSLPNNIDLCSTSNSLPLFTITVMKTLRIANSFASKQSFSLFFIFAKMRNILCLILLWTAWINWPGFRSNKRAKFKYFARNLSSDELEILFADLYCISFVALRPYEYFTAHFIIVFQKISGLLTTVHFENNFYNFKAFNFF